MKKVIIFGIFAVFLVISLTTMTKRTQVSQAHLENYSIETAIPADGVVQVAIVGNMNQAYTDGGSSVNLDQATLIVFTDVGKTVANSEEAYLSAQWCQNSGLRENLFPDNYNSKLQGTSLKINRIAQSDWMGAGILNKTTNFRRYCQLNSQKLNC